MNAVAVGFLRASLTALAALVLPSATWAERPDAADTPEAQSFNECIIRQSFLADDHVSPVETVATAVRFRCDPEFNRFMTKGLRDYHTDVGRQNFIELMRRYAEGSSVDMVLRARQWLADHNGQLPARLQANGEAGENETPDAAVAAHGSNASQATPDATRAAYYGLDVDRDKQVLIDKGSVVGTNAGTRQAWLVTLFAREQTGPDGKQYNIMMSHHEFDCALRRDRTIGAAVYEDEVQVWSGQNAQDWKEVVPDTNGDEMVAMVCGDRPWPPASLTRGTPPQIRAAYVSMIRDGTIK